ncbi:MAG TPA: ATP-binding protein [Vicinamibacterales bacterium]|nr:ATP-binding protein [Vicinamibacterales bacterium]
MAGSRYPLWYYHSVLSSLTNRIFLASTVLTTVSIGLALYFVSNRLRAEAEADLQRDLSEAATLVEQQRAVLFDNFARTARLIADLPKFKAAIETHDTPTVQPIAEDYHQQAGADLFRVTDSRGMVLASIGGEPSGVLQVVSVPVTIGLDDPDLLGTLTVGYLLDDERAATFKALTGADIAFAIDGQVRSSTLGADAQTRLEALLSSELVPRTMIGDSEYAALIRPLAGPPGVTAEGGAVPLAIVLRSRTARMQTLSAIQKGLALVAAVTVLLAMAISYGVARTVTRPLATITDHMRQIATTGDLTRKLTLSGSPQWHDEDARLLATTFNTLTDSIARSQREAAQRERLSSLGRMSTIVAHEIRNPLMIIKGALRQLSREGASTADIREAASDIDGETERLNRVVNEVLDFARPIRFDRSTTDINALCQDAACAVVTAEPLPPITTTLDPQVPTLETDSERLRTVLVNLLTNARQAVVAAGRSDLPGSAAVTMLTARVAERRVAISIRDRGVGISADDLPRIFDPYFTTRRAGTGLGLPIAKNIIDGLGGILTVSSTPGAGTEIRIELGDAQPQIAPVTQMQTRTRS